MSSRRSWSAWEQGSQGRQRKAEKPSRNHLRGLRTRQRDTSLSTAKWNRKVLLAGLLSRASLGERWQVRPVRHAMRHSVLHAALSKNVLEQERISHSRQEA